MTSLHPIHTINKCNKNTIFKWQQILLHVFLRNHSGWGEARLFLFVDNKELQILKLQKKKHLKDTGNEVQ